MRALRCTHVEVHVFRRRGRRIEFLALRRSPSRGHLPGVWQPVTGKIQWGEKAVDAARREVIEEIGVDPRRFWALESVTTWFDPEKDALIALPLFAAEIGPRDRVVLSGEHDKHAFLRAKAAGRRYLWEAQRRALEAVRHEVLGAPELARALEISPRAVRARGTQRRPRRAASARRKT